MQPKNILCIMLLFCATVTATAQSSYDNRVKTYIEQYKEWAMAEQKRSGVPAAITLAQGIHETSAGGSELALNANNHFGIKCRREWQGETYKYTDDAPDECFRKYPSAWQSYKDHSDYLAGSKRYEALFKLSASDYKGWAQGLKRCGYATNPKYAQLIIKLVETYQLQEYTVAAQQNDYNPVKEAEHPVTTASVAEVIPERDAPQTAATTTTQAGNAKPVNRKSSLSVSYGKTEQESKTPATPQQAIETPLAAKFGELVKVNGLKAFYARKGTVLLEDAFEYNIRYAKLLEINELPDLPLEANMYIFLEKKNAKGIHETHVVKKGQTLLQIAQAEAMQLKYLKYYNRIGSNEEPMEGATLQLQQYSEVKPATYAKTVAPREERTAFAGSTAAVIPQGGTRKRASYVSKKELSKTEEIKEPKFETQEAQPQVSEPVQIVEETKAEPAIAAAPIEQPAESTTTTELPATQPEAIASNKPTEATQPAPVEIVVAEEKVQPTETTELPKPEPIVTETAPVVAAVIPAEPAPVVEKQEIPAAETSQPVSTEKYVKEEIDYDVVQPAPVFVGKEPDKKVEEQPAAPTLPKAEKIATVAPAKTELKPVVVATKPVAAPAKIEVPQIPEEPKDEFDRLKAKLDKVVYAASANTPPPAPVEKKSEAKPDTTKTVKAPAKQEVAATVNSSKIYKVKKGDTAFSIAKKHNITMRQLMDWNKLDFDKVKEGQQLRVKP